MSDQDCPVVFPNRQVTFLGYLQRSSGFVDDGLFRSLAAAVGLLLLELHLVVGAPEKRLARPD
jgi:hypothetical protein